jgi:hypothetical protein
LNMAQLSFLLRVSQPFDQQKKYRVLSMLKTLSVEKSLAGHRSRSRGRSPPCGVLLDLLSFGGYERDVTGTGG